MANVKARADKESSSSEVKYSFFAGRWQPLHKGHLWLINERLKEGYNVWLGIRDVKPDGKNPWTSEEILEMEKEGELKKTYIKDNLMEGIGYIRYYNTFMGYYGFMENWTIDRWSRSYNK